MIKDTSTSTAGSDPRAQLEFADPIEPLDSDWVQWATDSSAKPVWLTRLDLHDERSRMAGIFVTPPRQVMGLPPWPDALEDVRDATPWVLFDVEKVVRMALHQSGLAFELLTSPHAWSVADFPARQIADAAFHAGLIGYYRDIATPLTTGAREMWRWRSLLTGWLVATESVVSQRLPELVDRAGDERLQALLDGQRPGDDVVEEYLEAMVSQAGRLGDGPRDYAWLDEFVYRTRVELV